MDEFEITLPETDDKDEEGVDETTIEDNEEDV